MALSWPYHFVSLSEEEKLARRHNLNLNGFYAYVTPIIICCVVGMVRASTYRTAYGSPRGVTAPTWIQRTSRRMQWWLSTPLSAEFGSRQVHLVGVIYTTWLLFLSFRQTSDDYLHLTKQLGHVAVSQLPCHYLLAVKSPSSPIQGLTGLSHETMLPYHRLFGRIIHMLILAHGMLYINFFMRQNILLKRLSSSDVLLGLAAAMMLNVLAFNSIPPIRKIAYHNKFYKSHVVLSITLLPALFFHVPYTRLYVVQCFIIAAFNAVSRTLLTSEPTLASVKVAVDGTNLVRLRIPGPSTDEATGRSTQPGLVPGQHCYVKQGVSPMMPRSPFTIASTCLSDVKHGANGPSNIELVFRNLNGPMTGWLSKKPDETGKVDQNVTVFIEGPYGESAQYMPRLSRRDDGDVLLVAGGVGATFTIPIYLSLLQELAKTKKAGHGERRRGPNRKIIFVWVVRSRTETAWGVEMLKAGLANLEDAYIDMDMRIYVTNRAVKAKLLPAGTASTDREDGVAKATAIAPSLATARSPVVVDSMLNHDKSMRELSDEQSRGVRLTGLQMIEDQRPNLNALVTETFGCTAPPTPFISPKSSPKGSPITQLSRNMPRDFRYERVTVLTCGPRSLGLELRREVGRHVMGYGREVDFREEVFGHGGA